MSEIKICTSSINSEIQIKWIINNFVSTLTDLKNSVAANGRGEFSIESDTFSTILSKKTDWRLQLRGTRQPLNNQKLCLSFELILMNKIVTSCQIHLFYIDNAALKMVEYYKSGLIKFDGLNNITIHSITIISEQVIRKFIDTNGQFILCCQLIEFEDLITSIPSFYNNHFHLLMDIKNLLETSFHSDVTLIVDNEKFKAHKCILSARSPVFSAMFNHNMIENQTNEIVITDSNPQAIKKLMEYIYSGKVDDFECDVFDLWVLSDKYDIKCLKEFCKDYVSKSLTVKSALKTLRLADQFNLTDLVDKVLSFVNHHSALLITTDEYAEMETSHPQLINKLYRNLVLQSQSSVGESMPPLPKIPRYNA